MGLRVVVFAVVNFFAVACVAANTRTLPNEAPDAGEETPAAIDETPELPDSGEQDPFHVEVRGDGVADSLRMKVASMAAREIRAFFERNPTTTNALRGHSFVYRVIPEDGKFSGAPEAALWPFSLEPFDSAYGATCTTEAKDDEGAPYRMIFIRNTQWLPITTAHETIHAIHFSVERYAAYRNAVENAFVGASVTVDGAVNAYENLAYKGQFFLSGQGGFLQEANDPAFELLTSWFGGAVFPENAKLAGVLLHPKAVSDAGE